MAVYVVAAALLLHGRRFRFLVDNRLRGGACESGDPWWLSPRPHPVWRRFGPLRMWKKTT